MARIFLSYAREDEAQVRDVYRRLLNAGFKVWMDKIDLLPDQRWQQEIPRIIRSFDFILIFISKNSVANRGYIQREFRLALDTLEEIPPDAIHTIPIHLDDCQIPEQFHHLQRSDLSEAGAFDCIIQALRWGMEQRQTVAPEPALEPPPNPISDKDRTFSSESKGRSVAETPVHPIQEPERTTISQSEKSLVPDPKSHRVSVITIVSLVIAVVSALAAVIVVPEVTVWLGLDKPPEQRETSEPVSPPLEITTSIGMELVRIPAGAFQMGSHEGYDSERPVHRVRISEPFYMGKYEVTQAQWEAVMGTNPSRFKGNPNRPVENVSWNDVQEFIKRLNEQEGWEVCRLPTEAQWEYAARAGTTEQYENDLDAIAWNRENSSGEPHEVGQKLPNAWGLYDMLGNVWEWVQDWYDRSYYQYSPIVDPQGPSTGVNRISRGGGWDGDVRFVRAFFRGWYNPGIRIGLLGFRCSSSGPSK